MANSSTTARVDHRNQELTVQHNQTDSPLLPVAQLEHLHKFRPDIIDWVINQTQVEAEYRRTEMKRINTFVYTELLLGQIFAFAIGIGGIGVGAYVALQGQPWAGGTIASLALTGLAVVFLTGRTKTSNS